MKKDKVVRTKAHLSDTITELEVKNRKVALKAAREAIVLLENDGVLPLAGKSKIAMFGEGVTNTVKGGGGSGEVNERKSTSVYEGMLEAGFQITSAAIIEDYAKTASEHRKDFFEEQQKKAGLLNFSVTMANMKKPYVSPAFPALKEEQLDTETDTCIYIISRICSESYDRQLEPGDYYLSETELHNIRLCAAHYTKLILVINAGGPIDLCALDDIYISANINMSMLGSAGGTAFAEVVSGKVSPSGKLSSTWPVHYEDFPYAKEYSYLNDNTVQEYYKHRDLSRRLRD